MNSEWVNKVIAKMGFGPIRWSRRILARWSGCYGPVRKLGMTDKLQ